MSTNREKTTTKRKAISLETKVTILNKLKAGQGSTSVAKAFGLNESTVRSIKQVEDSIRKSVSSGTNVSQKFSSYKRDKAMEEMEKVLIIWIEDNVRKRIPVDTGSIKHKALRIFQLLKDKDQTPSVIEFSASKGWFENFKKRHNLHNLHIRGELASGNAKTASEYPAKLARIIEENSYSADQVFNADETGLFWKKMPKRTYLSKTTKSASGFKAAKDRVTLLFCSNASGDRMLKPLFINKSQMPRAMKGENMEKLPVYWRANKKAWMTSSMFEDWFQNCFIPEVKSYLQGKNLQFKVLLLLDNSPSHPINLQHPNVRVEFLPPNTTSIIQPLDQGVIATFKAYYVRRSFADVLSKLDANHLLTLPEVWKNFTISKCVTHVASSVAELKNSTLNACWKQIWPGVVGERHVVSSTDILLANIIDLAHSIGGEGFDDLEVPDIEELFEEEEIADADLVDLVSQVPDAPNEISSDDSNIVVKALTANTVSEGLRLGKELQMHFLNNDPDAERAMKFQRKIQEALIQYEEVYKDLRQSKQLRITDFLTISTNQIKATNLKADKANRSSDNEALLRKF